MMISQVKTEDMVSYGSDSKRLQDEEEIIERAKHILRSRCCSGKLITGPDDVRDYLITNYSSEQNEIFGCIFLTTQHRIISSEILFHGSINFCSVHIRVLAQKCLEKNAGACIIFHNHPSGNLNPSTADRNLTKDIVTALKLFDISVIDHLIIGCGDSYSFAENGLL